MSSGAIAPGTVIARYRIVSTLGAGGMGQVYLAQDLQLNRPVALKVLPPELTDRPDRIGRFMQEAQAASALNHPNVAHIYEIGEADGVRFIAMEYVEGQTLSAKIGGKPVASEQILDIAVQAADALDEAHSKGIVHRDIKASNIMVTARGQVKVLDFGLAKMKGAAPASASSELATQAITSPGVVMGTTQYMSPEQVLGRDVDGRSDIFSFGVVLYEMATGRLPFQGSTQTGIMQQIAQAQPEAVARFNYDITPELERILRKCLEKDRERRYQSARDLLIDLKNLKRDTGSGSRTVTGASAVAPARKATRRWIAAVAVLALALSAAGYLLFRGKGGEAIDSVAVLPFANTAGDANLEYLSDGITEELINSLTQVPKLKVMARATVFTYKGKQPDPKQVGRDLQVRAVLMGRVAQRGDNLSVQVDLVDARDGSQIWGRQYNRKSVEMQTVQEEIARQVTDKMRMKLSGEAESRMAKRSTQNPEAYKLYLQGRFSLGELTEDNVRKALAFFEQAIAKDPDYALGHAGLADAYSYLGHLEIVPPKDAFPKAKDSALRALQLDPALAEAHASLGILHLLYDWDWPGAETELRRAMELNPGNAYIRHWFAHYLETMGRLAEAQVEMERALDMDPLSDMIGFDMVLNYSYSRQREKALEAVRKAVQLHPHNPFLQASLGYVLADAGKREEAIAELQKAAPSADIVPPLKAFIASTYALAGKPQEARKMLAEVEALAGKRFVSPYYLAEVHFALGDTDQGFAALNRAYELRSSAMTFLVTDPVFGRYRSDPRFIALLKKLNLPVEPKRAPL